MPLSENFPYGKESRHSRCPPAVVVPDPTRAVRVQVRQVQHAVLSAEDHRFYEHHGIDLVRTAKAAWIDFSAGHVVQGGSTLTQQLMKNFFLTSQRDWHRKVKEALMAYIAERRYFFLRSHRRFIELS